MKGKKNLTFSSFRRVFDRSSKKFVIIMDSEHIDIEGLEEGDVKVLLIACVVCQSPVTDLSNILRSVNIKIAICTSVKNA